MLPLLQLQSIGVFSPDWSICGTSFNLGLYGGIGVKKRIRLLSLKSGLSCADPLFSLELWPQRQVVGLFTGFRSHWGCRCHWGRRCYWRCRDHVPWSGIRITFEGWKFRKVFSDSLKRRSSGWHLMTILIQERIRQCFRQTGAFESAVRMPDG